MADISKIDNGTEYNLKDATARAGIESSKTIKSSVVTVPDAAPINAEDITVDITPQQDLHGYDKPWAGGAGKNKLPYFTAGEKNGIRLTYDNGAVVLNGTASANAFFPLTDLNLPSNNYVFSANNTIANNGVHVALREVGADSDFADLPMNDTDKYNTYRNVSIGRITLYVISGTQLTNFKLPLQIEVGDSKTEYEPYSNICPIEGRTGAELDRVGKNWFDYSSLKNYLSLDTVTGLPVYNDTRCATENPIDVSKLDAVTLTYVSSGNVISFIYSAFKNNTLVRRMAWNVSGATLDVSDVDTLYIAFHRGTDTITKSLLSNIMLSAGTQPTTYEPYQGQQYTVSFGETVHGGKWHVTEGGTDKTYGNIASYNGETINEPWLSSMDEYVAGATPTTGAQVVYPLSTPTTINTPAQAVPMLQGINTVYADCGDTQLKYQPDNVVGELKGEIEDNIIYEDFKWTTESSQSYSAGTPGTYGTSSWRDVKKEGYDVIGVTFVENRRFGDCILTLCYIPSTNHVEVIIFRATSSAVTIADEDIEYRVAYKKA